MAIDDRCKLFVAGLPDSITEAVLRQLFEATGGTVVEISVPRDRATGRPRGFGFISLATEEEAQAARESLDGSMQSGRSISVRPFQAAQPKRGDGPGPSRGDAPQERGSAEDRTLYLGNLPYDTSAQQVEELLEQAGVSNVVRVNLPLDPAGRPRGFGFVILASTEAAQAAVDALREVDLKGRRVSASIAHARGTGPRPARPPGGPMMGGGGGYPPRAPEPRWGGDPPAGQPLPLPGEEGEGRGDGRRRGPKETAQTQNQKKKGPKGAERSRNRRDGEGLRGPRARGFFGKDDE
jgi:nucleolin